MFCTISACRAHSHTCATDTSMGFKSQTWRFTCRTTPGHLYSRHQRLRYIILHWEACPWCLWENTEHVVTAARDRTEVLCSHGMKTKWTSNNHVPWTVNNFLHQKEPQLCNKHNYTWPSLWCLLDSIQDCPAPDKISNLHGFTNHLSPS